MVENIAVSNCADGIVFPKLSEVPRFSIFDYPPTRSVLNRIEKLAGDALSGGNVHLFATIYEAYFARQRKFSWIIDSEDYALKMCLELLYKGVYKTPEENATHLWFHERAHQKKAEKLGVRSVIRIGQLVELGGYHAYLELNVQDLLRRTNEKPAKILNYLGTIMLAPEKEGYGYKTETDSAKYYLQRPLQKK
jgi:hypothetical protein